MYLYGFGYQHHLPSVLYCAIADVVSCHYASVDTQTLLVVLAYASATNKDDARSMPCVVIFSAGHITVTVPLI